MFSLLRDGVEIDANNISQEDIAFCRGLAERFLMEIQISDDGNLNKATFRRKRGFAAR
jgi:hypothetical protein